MEQITPPELPTTPPALNNTEPNNSFQNIDKYYQNEFSKIQNSNESYKGKWNWYSFFFSWIWLFTKGAWGFAIIMLISLFLASNSNLSIIVSIGWALISGFRGTYIYYNVKVKNKQLPKSLI